MELLSVGLVVASGLIHAIWNLFSKQSGNKAAFLWLVHLIAVIVVMPWAVAAVGQWTLSWQGMLLLAASLLVHGLYIRLLVAAYTKGDLSYVYPIMRGISPLIVPLAAVVLFGESLTWPGWIGVALIVSGIVWMNVGRGMLHSRPEGAPFLLAIAVGLSIACYTLIDKAALHYVPAAILNQLSNVVNLLMLTPLALKSGAIRSEWKRNRRTIVLGGFLAPGGYILFLLALTVLPVAQLAPMREIGTVFAAIFGLWLLKERQGARRLLAALWIVGGVLLLGMFG